MNDITVLGIDLAKNTLQLIGVDKHHKEVFKKRVSPQRVGGREGRGSSLAFCLIKNHRLGLIRES